MADKISKMRISGTDYVFDKIQKVSTVTSLSNLDVSNDVIIANLSGKSTFSLSGSMVQGQRLTLICNPSSDFEQSFIASNVINDFDSKYQFNKSMIGKFIISCYDPGKYAIISCAPNAKKSYIIVSTGDRQGETLPRDIELYKMNDSLGTTNWQVVKIPKNSTNFIISDLKYGFKCAAFKTDGYTITTQYTSHHTGSGYTQFGTRFITKIDMSHLDTSKMTNMSHMFSDLGGVDGPDELNLTGINSSNVTKMVGMFLECRASNIILSDLDMSMVTDATGMFRFTRGVKSINFGRLNAISLEHTKDMFHGFEFLRPGSDSDAGLLPALDLSGCIINTSKVKDLSWMFAECVAGAIIVPSISSESATNIGKMFSGCQYTTYIDCSSLDPTSEPTNIFEACNKLDHIKCKSAFKDACKIDQLPSNMKPGQIGRWELVDIDSQTPLANAKISRIAGDNNPISISFRKYKQDGSYTDSTSGRIYPGSEWYIDTDGYGFTIMDNKERISWFDMNGYKFKPESRFSTNLSQFFEGFESATSIDVGNLDTSKVTRMDRMFHGCSQLSNLNLSGFSTESLTNCIAMFEYCTSLNRLYLDKFDLSHMEPSNAADMFQGVRGLQTIRSTKKFRDWCWRNQDIIKLPAVMREGGVGTWDLVDGRIL